jgi:hypothetical protein
MHQYYMLWLHCQLDLMILHMDTPCNLEMFTPTCKFSKTPYALCQIDCLLSIWPYVTLTPKGWSPIFGPFLKFRQAIVDAIFVQKTSNFWWTCGLVLASRRTNFYKILIFGLGIMPQKQNPSEFRATRAAKKLFIF